jgi:hypothetical protein
MLRCPAVEMKGFLLRRNQSVVGYFLLARTGWEGRLLDIFVSSDNPQDWRCAAATATHAIADEPEVCRIFAWAVAPRLRNALVQNGFWQQDEVSIAVRDPRNLLEGAFPASLQMFDGESAYLTG